MGPFDLTKYLNELSDCLTEPFRYWQSPADYPLNNAHNKRSEIVLKSDMEIELGGASYNSCSFTVYTREMDKFDDNIIRLYGKDLNEADSGTLPFAQILLAAGDSSQENELYRLFQYSMPPGLLKGIMIKRTDDKIWYRISREAIQNGMSFEKMGNALLSSFRAELPWIKKAAIVYVTSDLIPMSPLQEISRGILKEKKVFKHHVWEKRGFDPENCSFGTHCGACKDKKACDEIRKLEQAYQRKGLGG